jgi:hypothetical protein
MPRVPRRKRRIAVLCEGATEELALRHFVTRQWEQDGLGSVSLDSRDLRGHLDRVGRLACVDLDEPNVLAVFALVDLYGVSLVTHLPNDALHAKVERVRAWLKNQLGDHTRAHDFLPHVSVHEVEAWILAEGSALSRRLRDPGITPDPQAESKNFENPPSDRLNDLFRRTKSRRYHKILDGTPLFKTMRFEPVYRSCRYFREFYDDLTAVARRAA